MVLTNLSLALALAVPTPFASHAFHPFDGFITGLPYHLFVFVVPVSSFHGTPGYDEEIRADT